MRILLISVIENSRNVEIVYQPLGLGYLASYASREIPNLEFKVIDRNYEKTIREFNPDIVGITTVSQNYSKAIKLAKICAKYKKLSVLGGIHISMLPISINKSFDVAVIGEGEVTFTELIKRIIKLDVLGKKRPALDYNQFKDIPGLLFHTPKGIMPTGARELIKNLDDIPLPDRSLLNINSSNTYMFSSRGCPYKCIFCASSRFWARTRFHSAEYVVNEIEHIHKIYGCTSITFYDDLFIANLERLKAITYLLKKRRLLGKIEFSIQCRANLVNEKLVKLLHKLNVVNVSMGLESGSETILKYLKGGNVTVEMNRNAVRLLKRAGISVGASFIIGCPIDTKETIKETYDFIKEVNLNNFEVYIMTPFVGTPMWDYALSKKLVSPKMDFSILDVANHDLTNPKSIYVCQNLSKEELQKELDKFLSLRIKNAIKNNIKVALLNPKKVLLIIIRKLKFLLAKR